MKVFGDISESACLSVRPCVHLWVHLCTKILVFSPSAGGGIKSHLVTALVFVAFVKDNATMSSVRYFENHVSYICAKLK